MTAVFLLQLHDHLKSLRFQVSLLTLLLFFVANGVVYAWKMERLAGEQEVIAADNDRRYQEVQTVSQAVAGEYRIATRPLGSEFICEGGFNWFMDAFRIQVYTDGGAPMPTNLLTTNNWMRRFDLVDWALVARLVLSFLCLVIAYDTVSGELENGTLRLTLSHPLSRGRFLMGKFAAHLTALLAGLVVGGASSLLILSLNGVLSVDADLLRACGLFLLGAALYVSLFLLVAMGVSALAPSSAASLVLLVLVWAGLIVIIPQASYPIAVRAVDAPGDYQARKDEVVAEVHRGLAREGIALRGRDEGRVDDYAMERRYARRLQEAHQESERIVQAADAQMLRRYRVARTINLLSPGYAFQYAVEAFLGTGVQRREAFFAQAWRYRDALRASLRDLDAADPESPHILYLAEYMSRRPLEPGQMPRFQEQRLSLTRSLAAGLVPIVALVLEAGLAFFFALWAIHRAQLTD